MLKTSYSPRLSRSREEHDEWQKMMSSHRIRYSGLAALLSDVWQKGHETKEHGERMAELTWHIGKSMGLPKNQLQDLIYLALVHDLGETMISDKILKKDGPLDELEWAEIKMHPVFGYDIALITPEIHHLADNILYHHERWDGRGYPYGLAGAAIPLLARIIAVADSFDTMTHDRSYRPAMDEYDAQRELQMNAGRQFDPTVVADLIDLLRR